MANLRLLVVCPSFNEEKHIGPLLKQIKKHLNLNDELIVINDGSTDATLDEAMKENVRVISHSRNLGKGEAIKTGFKYFSKSKHDVILFMDGDGQHNPLDIKKFRNCFVKEQADVVIASRFRTQAWIHNMPFSRKLSNMLSRFGLWILFNGFYVEDPQNGFRAYNREVANHLQFYSNGYEAETEILIDAYLKGFDFKVVSIESIYHGHERTSKFSLLMDTWKIPGIMIKGFFKFKPWTLRSINSKLQYRASKYKIH
ncbi:MAG: Undecaprenyl-phosphate mannosyltransferase [Candidatus Heimdallarchaeota archaeon LC_2]|nr:MAG: Undecaprenyl-phosphate mannosyltransferase [Candidatus Heimdallarchaeota archaeon LC_2]